MVLTERQQSELHDALVEYLAVNGHAAAASTVAAALKVTSPLAAPSTASVSTLEKKWTSVVRLQKKVMELEATVGQLQDEMKSRGGHASSSSRAASSLLPHAPATHVLSGHRDVITSLAFHPTFSVVVAGGEDGTAKAWDYETGALEASLRGHTDAVTDVAFSPGGQLCATASADLSIKLWTWDTHSCLKTLQGHDHTVSCVRFLHASRGSGSGGDVASSASSSMNRGSATSPMLLSSSRDGTVRLWDCDTGYCVKTINISGGEWIRQVVISPFNQFMATCYNDTIKIYTMSSYQSVGELRGHEHVIESLCFSSGDTFTIGDKGQLVLAAKDATSRKSVAGTPLSLSKPSDASKGDKDGGGTIASVLLSGCRDKTIRVWCLRTMTAVRTLKGHDNWVRCVCFHPTRPYAISTSDDRSIRVWDLESSRCIRTLSDAHTHFVTCGAYSPAVPLLATGGVDKLVKIWECL